MINKLKQYQDDFDLLISKVSSLKELAELRSKFLGKKGSVSLMLIEMRSLSDDQKPQAGKHINEFKKNIATLIQEKTQVLEKTSDQTSVRTEGFDTTLPGRGNSPGSIHPISQIMDEVISIFFSLGFRVEEGPEIESDFYNFEALNIPKDHPARDMQDTFYIGEEVLRTHTSPVQIHVMENQKPPLRIIAPGKVFRCDSDISHTPMFHQIEGLMVDENLSFGDLKGVMNSFLYEVFGKQTKTRFRPSFFPFTCPSAEVDIECVMCSGQGCRVCSKTGWLEILGCGMVDPAVFKSVDYDPERWLGFAFGLGIERIAMLKYKINDIRLFFENDLRFLKQF
ncbi:MAG: phenylalanine--tRNA ligase subunit alpha [Nitrospina sp.]|nr:phenylalanine--tRNA ligase subunit alpha [Nitrospina sp.]